MVNKFCHPENSFVISGRPQYAPTKKSPTLPIICYLVGNHYQRGSRAGKISIFEVFVPVNAFPFELVDRHIWCL